MGRQVVELERTWGTTDEECRAFVLDLYRNLYESNWRRHRGERAGPIEVDADRHEVVVDASDWTEAQLLVSRAASAADPHWRRLYRFSESQTRASLGHTS